MQSNKTWHRPDARNRQHRPSPNNTYPKIVDPKTPKVGAVEAAARIANLKLLLSRVDGDVAMLAAAVQLEISGLKQRLEGLEVVEDGLAMYIEETLALDPSWLDKKHVLTDISAKTVDILYGRDISDSEEEIRQSEQRGHEIMKNTAASANAAPATRAPHTPSTEKPAEEIIQARIANLILLTQARGAKSRLARLLIVSESIISFLFNRKKEFTNRFTRELENVLSLPANWFDTVQKIQAVPQATWDKLGSSVASAPAPSKPPKSSKPAASQPLTLRMSTTSTDLEKGSVTAGHNASRSAAANAPAPSLVKAPGEGTPTKTPRVHRVEPKPQNAPELTLHFSTTSAPSELLLGAELPELQQNSGRPEVLPELDDGVSGPVLAGAEAAAPDTPQPPVAAAPASAPAAAPVVTVRARRAPAPHAPALAAGANSPATGGAKAPKSLSQVTGANLAAAPAPAAAAAPTPAAPTQLEQSGSQPAPAANAEVAISRDIHSKPDTLAPSGFVLHPITEALIKTLTMKAKEGKFNEKEALRLLVEIAEL